MAKVTQKDLDAAGLKFRFAKGEEIEEGGKKKKIMIPASRPLTMADLIGQADNGDGFTVATADGKKYTIQKAAAVKDNPPEKPDGGKGA